MQCRNIFEMDSEEFSKYLEPIAATLIAKAFDDGLYVSYPADGNMPNRFIHEYKDGRTVVVEIDLDTGKEHIVPLPQN